MTTMKQRLSSHSKPKALLLESLAYATRFERLNRFYKVSDTRWYLLDGLIEVANIVNAVALLYVIPLNNGYELLNGLS